jgi:hypothetical protein
MDNHEDDSDKKTKKINLKLRAKVYPQNPFMTENYPMVQTRTKRITNNKGGYLIKGETGETVAAIAGFWQAEEVDSTKFVKLYVGGVKAFSGLSTKGTKVFELMYYEMQREIGKDKIYLSFNTIDTSIVKLARTTFYDGLNELVEKKFLAPTESPHWYWINPDYIWNGDRLAFVKTYVKKHSDAIPKRADPNLELPFEPFENNIFETPTEEEQ